MPNPDGSDLEFFAGMLAAPGYGRSNLVCGYGEVCPMSALPWVFGKDVRVTPDKFCNVEDQTETWNRTSQLGQNLADRIKTQTNM